MKTIEEIKGIKRCSWGTETKDGIKGINKRLSAAEIEEELKAAYALAGEEY